MTQVQSSLYRSFVTLTLMVIIGALACSGSSFDAGSPPPPGTPRLDLKVASTRNPSSVPEGGSVTFTVTVTNLGPVDATNVTAGGKPVYTGK